jgi:hypothetical protein
LYLFAQHSLCSVGIMRIICEVHKDVDVVLLPVLLCVHHWLYVLPRWPSSYVVNWSGFVDTNIRPKLVVRKKGD